MRVIAVLALAILLPLPALADTGSIRQNLAIGWLAGKSSFLGPELRYDFHEFGTYLGNIS
jgi:hypothetical protein